MDSPAFSYMLNHNVDRVDPLIAQQISDPLIASTVVSVSNIVQIKSKDQLSDSQDTATGRLSACLCVVKPNQPLNVACKICYKQYLVRTLKSIANNKELGLTIQNLEITRYEEKQLDLLFKHDIEFDEMIPAGQKANMREQYYQMFNECKGPVVQFLVSGPYAISKM